jgi:hypothetical protein
VAVGLLSIGAPGVSAAVVAGVSAQNDVCTPTRLRALTRNMYWVFGLRPVAVSVVTWTHSLMPPSPPVVVESKYNPDDSSVKFVKVPVAMSSILFELIVPKVTPVGVSMRVVATALSQ